MLDQKPYFIRAIHEWCSDNELTPYLASKVDSHTIVPSQYIQDGQIILNIANIATKDLTIDKEWITFQATFGGIINDIAIPINNVIAIFAKENGEGMQFETAPSPSIQKNNLENKQSRLKLVK
ncbi:MAG TPA: ClpXP protease specificity-enhancing factor [Burkholderiales bacterium]|nr:ClpXP protease specificity-enhancing factor [Burkholderiales bacterium]